MNAKINTLFLKWNHIDNGGSDLLCPWVRFLKSVVFPTLILHLNTWKQIKPFLQKYLLHFSILVPIREFQYQYQNYLVTVLEGTRSHFYIWFFSQKHTVCILEV